MGRPLTDLLRGTLDLLILQTLVDAPLHGWALAQRIEQQSENILRVGQGSLYPALQRLEHQGWIESEWRHTDQNRPATRAHRRNEALAAVCSCREPRASRGMT
jgi:PadR family transcriptional regulator, regulatory protein PadR